MVTVTLTSKRLRNEGGVNDPDEEEEGCTHMAVSESYYTKAKGASRI